MKATLVLLPLLGITYMLFFVNPGEDEVSRVVFIYFNSFLESFQVSRLTPHSGSGCPPRTSRPWVGILPGRGPEGQEAVETKGVARRLGGATPVPVP